MADQHVELSPGIAPGTDGNNTPAPQPPVGGSNTPVVAPPAEKTFSYKEDRTDWVPRHRLNEQSGKLTEVEKRALAAETALEQERKRVRALSGVEPRNPQEEEANEVRQAVLKLFPNLELLEGLSKEQLDEVRDAAKTARQASAATWERHTTSLLNDLYGEAADKLGVEKLSESQEKRLKNAYRDSAAECLEERRAAVKRGEREDVQTQRGDADFIARHESGDKTFLKDFVKAYLDDFYEPAKRSVNVANARRNMRPVPRGERSRSILTQGAEQLDLTNDEQFKKAMAQARAKG